MSECLGLRNRSIGAIAVAMFGALLGTTSVFSPVWAADLSARDISILLFRAAPGSHPALNNRNLMRLDLASLDFKKADLRQANLFGTDLTGANLSGVDLSGARLDRAVIISARFDGATLDDASLMRPATTSTLVPIPREAPSLKGASLKRVKFFGDFSGSDFSGADLTDSVCAPINRTGFIEHLWRSVFVSANLSGAILTRANMDRSQLSFAVLKGAILHATQLRGADLSGADLSGADLSGADLTDADLTDANITGADLSGTRLHGAIGLESLKGLSLARNSDKIIR
ncbi:pentapeptide repeat-containing protein [Hyphomicrobium sp. MC1]|uniref:pentapeptide repeat-containing protein n=1 Tax=Hyphomicrobium sp. (strain MC1) TaxID=717785 RepID=UPI000213E65E|nr:pentapeptide repeat-containing protein [Hyphomicrobium sp. MC1]CCB65303.1 Pentapeptide repeat protein [Hyphomicrobium sp. MC1]